MSRSQYGLGYHRGQSFGYGRGQAHGMRYGAGIMAAAAAVGLLVTVGVKATYAKGFKDARRKTNKERTEQ